MNLLAVSAEAGLAPAMAVSGSMWGELGFWCPEELAGLEDDKKK